MIVATLAMLGSAFAVMTSSQYDKLSECLWILQLGLCPKIAARMALQHDARLAVHLVHHVQLPMHVAAMQNSFPDSVFLHSLPSSLRDDQGSRRSQAMEPRNQHQPGQHVLHSLGLPHASEWRMLQQRQPCSLQRAHDRAWPWTHQNRLHVEHVSHQVRSIQPDNSGPRVSELQDVLLKHQLCRPGMEEEEQALSFGEHSMLLHYRHVMLKLYRHVMQKL